MAKESHSTDFLHAEKVLEWDGLVFRELARVDDDVGRRDSVSGVNHAVDHHNEQDSGYHQHDGLLVPGRIAEDKEDGQEQEPTLKLYFGVKETKHSEK